MPPRADKDLDDLASVINGAIEIPPLAAQAAVGVVDPPLATDGLAVSAGRLAEARQEARHPAIGRAAIDGDAALGQPRDAIGVAEALPARPAPGQGDEVVWKAVAREGTGRAGGEAPTAGMAALALAAQARHPVPPRPLAPAPRACHHQPPPVTDSG
jgi:hypothetical protein